MRGNRRVYDDGMAETTQLISVTEYLATNYKPSREYVDGVLYPKPMGTRKHGIIQARIAALINANFEGYEAGSEISVQMSPAKILIPDVIVQDRKNIQDPYPTEPVHLCIEILSPADRISEAFAKAEDYHAWGVPTVWILDPEARRSWEYCAGQRPVEIPAGGSLHAGEISITCKDIFAALD